MHDVVGLTNIVGPDLRYRMFLSYVMSSVLTYHVVGDLHHVAYGVVGFLHHVAYDIPCDVSFDSKFRGPNRLRSSLLGVSRGSEPANYNMSMYVQSKTMYRQCTEQYIHVFCMYIPIRYMCVNSIYIYMYVHSI